MNKVSGYHRDVVSIQDWLGTQKCQLDRSDDLIDMNAKWVNPAVSVKVRLREQEAQQST